MKGNRQLEQAVLPQIRQSIGKKTTPTKKEPQGYGKVLSSWFKSFNLFKFLLQNLNQLGLPHLDWHNGFCIISNFLVTGLYIP